METEVRFYYSITSKEKIMNIESIVTFNKEMPQITDNFKIDDTI